jgi:hypothetical protein
MRRPIRVPRLRRRSPRTCASTRKARRHSRAEWSLWSESTAPTSVTRASSTRTRNAGSATCVRAMRPTRAARGAWSTGDSASTSWSALTSRARCRPSSSTGITRAVAAPQRRSACAWRKNGSLRARGGNAALSLRHRPRQDGMQHRRGAHVPVAGGILRPVEDIGRSGAARQARPRAPSPDASAHSARAT